MDKYTYVEISSTGEKFTVLVERYSHDTISGIESLLNAITVMHINVNV